ncbi:hydroxylase [Virgisporangium aurantiacum]|uniref:Hydroxylase n=2 Tax=Virgisporangium aurantiacum TaxID=175570 RepID=A0A8J4E422_9ACTN|nr:hydroxylase [Virgisporangium aurantiacum]
MAGLLAARVLADEYERVTVVERDPLPPAADNRRGVPQGRHGHTLLPSGADIIDELFPGLLGELVAAGAPRLDNYTAVRFVPDGVHRLAPPAPPVEFLHQASRPLLEAAVRTRIRGLTNVEILDGCAFVGLVTSAARDRVTGARVFRHGAPAEQVLTADLVIDATGRGSRTPTRLAELGYRRPPEDEVEIDLRYASRLIRFEPGAVPEQLTLIGPTPRRPRAMALFAYENDTWLFTVSGYAGHHPAADYRAMVEFAAPFAPPHIVAALRDARPLADVSTFRFRANRRRRYERMRRFPRGLLVVGDAMCSFNPIYGQGMSVAAKQAIVLRHCLRRGDGRLARRFFRLAARPVGTAWRMAVGADLALPQVDGPRSPAVRLGNAYVHRVLVAAEHDPVVAARFLRVSAFLDKPSRLMAPSIIARIIARIIIGNRRAEPDRQDTRIVFR